MDAAFDLFLTEEPEPALHEVEPGSTGRREVYVKPRALEQPAPDQGGLMRPVIIEDQVDREVARHVGLNGLKKLAKLNGPVPSMGLPDDGTGLRIQRRKQRGGAMTPVVMAAPLSLPRLQGQQRLAAIQRLDLRLLIDAQDEGLCLADANRARQCLGLSQ